MLNVEEVLTFQDLWIAGPCQGGASVLASADSDPSYERYFDAIRKSTTRFEIVNSDRVIEWVNDRGIKSRLTLIGDQEGKGHAEFISRLDTHPATIIHISSNNHLEFANAIVQLMGM